MTTLGYRPSNYQPRAWTQSTITRADYYYDQPYRPGDGLRYTSGMAVKGMEYQPDWHGSKPTPCPTSEKPKYTVPCAICGKPILKRKLNKCWDCWVKEKRDNAKTPLRKNKRVHKKHP